MRGDAGPLTGLWSQDPEVTRYQTRRPFGSLREVEEFLDTSLAEWEGGKAYAWSLLLRESGALVGMIEARVDSYMVNVSYLLGRAYWNKGLTTEAVRGVCAWADDQADVFRIWAVCAVDNPASARVLEKAGMTREGLLRRWAVFPNIDGTPKDCYSYARIKELVPQAAP